MTDKELTLNSGFCTVMPMCVFLAHILYVQCMLGPRGRTGHHID